MVATAAGPNGLALLTERLVAPLARAATDAVRHLGLALEPGEAEPQADAEPAADAVLPGPRSRAATVPELRTLAGAARAPAAEGPAPPRGPSSQPRQGVAARPSTAVAMPGALAGGPGRIDAGDASAATAAPGDRDAAWPQADAGREAQARTQAAPIDHPARGPAAAAAFQASTLAVVPAAARGPEPGMPSNFGPPPGTPGPRAAKAMAQAVAPALAPSAASPSLEAMEAVGAMAARPVAAPADPVFAAPAQAVADEAEAAALTPRPAPSPAVAPGAVKVAVEAPATASPFHAAPAAPATTLPPAAAPAGDVAPFPPGLRVRRAGPEGVAVPDRPGSEAGLAPSPSTPALAPVDAPMADAAIARPVSRQLRLVGSRLDRALAPVFGSASDSSQAAADGLSGEAAQGLQISNTFNVKVALGGHGALDPRQLEEALGDWLRAAAMRQGLMP